MNSKIHFYARPLCEFFILCSAAMLFVKFGCLHSGGDYGDDNEPAGVASIFQNRVEVHSDAVARSDIHMRPAFPSIGVEAITIPEYGAKRLLTASAGVLPDFPAQFPSSDDPIIANLDLDGPQVAGAISQPSETAWFRLVVDKPAVVEVDVDTVENELDAVLAYFGPDAIDKRVAANDDNDGKDPFIRTIVAPGTYYVAVGGFQEKTGKYHLEARTTATTDVPVGARAQTGQVSQTTPDAWYRLKIEDAGFFKLVASWREEGVEAKLEVALMAAERDHDVAPAMIGPAGFENTRLYALTEGVYYLVVLGVGLEEPRSFTLDFVELIEAVAP